MWKIYADDVLIYDDVYLLDDLKVVNPKLTLEDSSAGSLEITLPESNRGYSIIERMTTDIIVEKEGERVWAGRVLNDEKDFWNNRILYCEGELAFFNDTTQPPSEYHNMTVRGFLEKLVSIHNSKVGENRRFVVGAVTVTDPNDSLYRYTNNETTIQCINDKLVERLGGHLRVRTLNGVRVLDYLADYPNVTSQTIEFGKNLVDYTRKWDSSEFATVLLPLGEHLDESPIEALDAYLTVESVNDGSMYVQADTVEEYGWIEKLVHWDNVTTPERLLTKAKQYLSDLQFDSMKIELSALDLHYLNADYESIKLLDQIRVISKPHGMNRLFPVRKMTIDLANPENCTIELGDDVNPSLTSSNNAVKNEILQKIENLPKESAILDQARANATALINMATNGYITITTNEYGAQELYISNEVDYTQAQKFWRWNINGLGYSNNGGQSYNLAMTMDGAIVADFITTGTLNADIIKAGILQDYNGNTSFNLSTGYLTIKSGQINLGNGNFSVGSDGTLNAIKGNVGSFTITSNSIESDFLKLDNYNKTIVIYDDETSDAIARLASTHVGTTSDVNYQKGSLLSCGTAGYYVGISRENAQNYHDWILLYANKDIKQRTTDVSPITYETFSAGYIYLFKPIDGHNYIAEHFWINPDTGGANKGYTGNIVINSLTMKFKKGFLMSAYSDDDNVYA